MRNDAGVLRMRAAMSLRLPLRLLGIVSVLSFFGACGCDEDPLAPARLPGIVDAGFADDAQPVFADAEVADVGQPDTGPADSGVPPEPEARVLRFVGTSPVAVFFGASADLRFELRTASGAAVPRETIRFMLNGTGGRLSAQTVITDAAGDATVRYTAGTVATRDVLTAEADRAPSVTVNLEVREDPAAILRVDVSSTTRIAVARATAAVYVSTAGAPTCAQLLGGAAPAATHTALFPAVPGSQLYANQTTGAQVTALATGLNARGDVIARGCAEGLRLVGATTNVLAVVLAQLPSDLTGSYDALLNVDVGSALPPPYGPVIVTITDVLSDPAGWAVYQTLALLDQQVGTTFVNWTPPGGGAARPATFDEVRSNAAIFNVWRIASITLDDFLVARLGQPYIDVTNVGGDIAHVIRRFEVGAGFSVTSTGTPDRLRVEEEWKALVFQWQLGCPNGDLGCARRAIALTGANARLAPARAIYGARIAHAPSGGETERFELAMDAHAVNLRYGAVILLVLEQFVFPSLPGGLGAPNLTGVLGNIVRCPDVAQALSNATGFSASFFQTVCTTAVTAAASSLESRLLALDSTNNPGLVTGAGGGTLVLVDADHDLRTELLPSLSTFSAWSSGGSMPITAPIVGHGRRAASDCDADADCASAGLVCAPIASYLEVRAVEHDCRRPVGATVGAVGCALDSDCASGLCMDPGTGIRICYSACEDGAACALGMCRAGVARVSLDPVLMGLGNGTTAACVP